MSHLGCSKSFSLSCSLTYSTMSEHWSECANKEASLRTARFRASEGLVADGVGTVFGSLTGTSTVTSYIESAAG